MKIFTKLICKICGCVYLDKNLTSKYIAKYNDIGLFKMENYCVRCGKKYSTVVHIPMPGILQDDQMGSNGRNKDWLEYTYTTTK